ncbi:hypothetical protein MNV49_003324 [Pseudohyphozyma bogoriensis]|nr:hypothetical protein MNV49_003324 [Pseudohyphozyma bogoriensis]
MTAVKTSQEGREGEGREQNDSHATMSGDISSQPNVNNEYLSQEQADQESPSVLGTGRGQKEDSDNYGYGNAPVEKDNEPGNFQTAPDAAVSREEGDVQPAEKAKEKRGPVKRTPPKPRPKRVYPDLVDSEIEETWVRGSGPGGQSINKTNISCSLRHLPTGIRVQCHETRSRELNRTKARRRLQEKLDLLRNPGKSILEEKWERERKKKQAKKRKGKKKDGKDGAEEEKDEVDVEATQKSDEQP